MTMSSFCGLVKSVFAFPSSQLLALASQLTQVHLQPLLIGVELLCRLAFRTVFGGHLWPKSYNQCPRDIYLSVACDSKTVQLTLLSEPHIGSISFYEVIRNGQ